MPIQPKKCVLEKRMTATSTKLEREASVSFGRQGQARYPKKHTSSVSCFYSNAHASQTQQKKGIKNQIYSTRQDIGDYVEMELTFLIKQIFVRYTRQDSAPHTIGPIFQLIFSRQRTERCSANTQRATRLLSLGAPSKA